VAAYCCQHDVAGALGHSRQTPDPPQPRGNWKGVAQWRDRVFYRRPALGRDPIIQYSGRLYTNRKSRRTAICNQYTTICQHYCWIFACSSSGHNSDIRGEYGGYTVFIRPHPAGSCI